MRSNPMKRACLLLFACGLGLPLPEDIPLIVAGAVLCTSTKSWVITAIACWCGIIGGDCIIYFMGRRISGKYDYSAGPYRDRVLAMLRAMLAL